MEWLKKCLCVGWEEPTDLHYTVVNMTEGSDGYNNQYLTPTARVAFAGKNESRATRRLVKVYNADKECCICFEEEVFHAVMKCEHSVCCKCIKKISKCPLCGLVL